jgi:hypothetical protein
MLTLIPMGSGVRLSACQALFERIEILGPQKATIHPSPEAVAPSWRSALGDEVLTGAYRGDYGRGERI